MGHGLRDRRLRSPITLCFRGPPLPPLCLFQTVTINLCLAGRPFKVARILCRIRSALILHLGLCNLRLLTLPPILKIRYGSLQDHKRCWHYWDKALRTVMYVSAFASRSRRLIVGCDFQQAPSMKGEVMSPTSLQERPPSAPRVMHHSHSRGRSIDDSAFPAGNLSNLDRSISRPASFQDNLDRPPRKWPPKDDRSYQRFNRFDRNDARDSFTNGFQKFPQQRRSASPVSRNLSFDTGNDAFRQRPKIDRDRWERKPNDFYARVEQLDQVDNVPRRHTYNGDTTAIPDQSWSTGTKRSLSPGSARHDHPFTPHVKRHHPVSSVAAEAAAARRPMSYKKPYNPAMMTRRSASPVASKPWVFNARSDFLEQPNTRDPEPVAPMVVNETPNGLTPRPERINALNRELWDVRRQLTALKAREDSIAHELGALRAPVPADPAEKATTDGLSPEERIKAMELEMNCTWLIIYSFRRFVYRGIRMALCG